MSGFEDQFRAGLLNASIPAPAYLKGPTGRPSGSRYDVYRNNVTVSLISALRTAFPLVLKLLGRASFDNLAPMFVRAHPPSSPLMMHYGTEFPGFLETFEPLQHLGYLPDCARLDLAFRTSYHAASADRLNPVDLKKEPGEIYLNLAPATRVIRSSWPLYDIWLYNQQDDAAQPGVVAQDVMVTRPEFDPMPHALPPGAADWLGQLENGLSLDAAIDATVSQHPDFDLAAAMTTALTAGAFSALQRTSE